MNEVDTGRIDRQMLRREVPPGVDRPDRQLRVARGHLDQIEEMRDRPPETWSSPDALPRSLDHVAEALEELTWHDLARLAYLEELAVYRELDATRPGPHKRSSPHPDLTALQPHATRAVRRGAADRT